MERNIHLSMHEITLVTLLKIIDMFKQKSKSKSIQYYDNSPDENVYKYGLDKNKCFITHDTKDDV